MREIKFRAWGHFGSNTKDSMIENWQSSEYVEYVGFNGGESFTIMQFTGLKDKNGKEIYEGDLIKSVYMQWEEAIEVKWSTSRGGWFPFATSDGCGCCAHEVVYNDAGIADAEIIGNVYENPDLLKHNG